ncbi:MAG TPA: DNA-binding protein [Candidatus Dojkabacteria bacterium]|nr:DNA-binding protein [Candidatus Dojkabacteria bacterium]
MQYKYEVGQKIEVRVERFTALGVVVSFNDDEGLAYNSDIFEDLQIGKTYLAYIKEIRQDGKIDITFRRHGYKNFIESATEILMKKIKDNSGKLSLTDNSSPELIKRTLGISKRQFKQAVGKLLKERKIIIDNNGIQLK